MRLSLNKQSATALREFSDAVPVAVESIAQSTEDLMSKFQGVSDTVGVHREDFLEMLLLVKKAFTEASDALTLLPKMMRNTADLIDLYVASHPDASGGSVSGASNSYSFSGYESHEMSTDGSPKTRLPSWMDKKKEPGNAYLPKTIKDWTTNDLREMLQTINPNYNEFDIDSPYSTNCGSCAFAVFRRLCGEPDIVAGAENIGYNYQMEALTGMEQVKMSPDEIRQFLLSKGDGAHAIVGVDRSSGPGHWFNAICIDGEVYALDGQSGSIIGWPPDYGDVVNWEISIRRF